MKKIRAILVDDEESARDVLGNLLLRFCPKVELIGKYNDVEQGVNAIKELQPDLVFLDIEMPNYAGYEIVNFFEQIDFDIIFVTAYDKYAIRAFEISAVDYLLKPIDIDRLKQAVQKTIERLELKQTVERFPLLSQALETNEVKSIVITERGYQHIVELKDVIALEAQESYSYIYTSEKRFTASKNLKHFEKMLSDNSNIFRSHKSWLINLDFFDGYSKSNLAIELSNGLVAKLSKYKKAEFEALLIALR